MIKVDREELLEVIDEDIVDQAHFYDGRHLPPQISQAIYAYGSNDDYQIVAFVDASQEHDGSLGFIFNMETLYNSH